MEMAFAGFQKRIIGNLSQSTKEKYTSFISTYPNIEQSVKNYHIASYLGVTTETLSRIRKEIAQE
jgi:CRP-like cAMP-binding protein